MRRGVEHHLDQPRPEHDRRYPAEDPQDAHDPAGPAQQPPEGAPRAGGDQAGQAGQQGRLERGEDEQRDAGQYQRGQQRPGERHLGRGEQGDVDDGDVDHELGQQGGDDRAARRPAAAPAHARARPGWQAARTAGVVTSTDSTGATAQDQPVRRASVHPGDAQRDAHHDPQTAVDGELGAVAAEPAAAGQYPAGRVGQREPGERRGQHPRTSPARRGRAAGPVARRREQPGRRPTTSRPARAARRAGTPGRPVAGDPARRHQPGDLLLDREEQPNPTEKTIDHSTDSAE